VLQKELPARNGTDGEITLVDPHRNITPTCLDEPIGRLSIGPRRLTARPGRPATLTVRWEHPRRWGELRAVQVRLRSERRVVATFTFNQNKGTIALARNERSRGQRARLPRRARRTLRAGSVRLLLGRRTFRLPTRPTRVLRLRPRLVLGRSLAGRRLAVEVSATGDDGERQAFSRGGVIRVRRR
jgi:hypothetical protein